MYVILFLLAIVSFVALIVGLIKPSVLQTSVEVPTRKRILGILGGATFLFFFLSLIAAPTPSSTDEKSASNSVATTQQEATSVDAVDTSAEAAETAATSTEQGSGENEATTPPAGDSSESHGDDQNGNPVAAESVATSEPTSPQAEESQSAPAVEYYTVTRVVDGDTFKVSINGQEETVRVIGIDTPESVDPRKPVECFALEASNRAKALLTGKRVRLAADPTQDERDRYGRLLRYAWLENGTFFNRQMIVDGYAMEYTYNVPYQHQASFKQAQQEAQAAKRGLWADNACVAEPAPANTSTSVDEPAPAAPPAATQPSGYKFYVSSHYSSKFYYCETDPGWRGLSEKYLEVFSSEAALLKEYPKHTLHEPCN